MNEIEGSIPSELGLLKGLQDLVLSRNLLNFRLPTELGEMVSLQRFDVSGNPELTGWLPTEVESWEQIGTFHIIISYYHNIIPRTTLSINAGPASLRAIYLPVLSANLSHIISSLLVLPCPFLSCPVLFRLCVRLFVLAPSC
eukprot:jgi/Psemu1/305908/fgenesh1_kg.225_\